MPLSCFVLSLLAAGAAHGANPHSTPPEGHADVRLVSDEAPVTIGSWATNRTFLAPQTSLSPIVKRIPGDGDELVVTLGGVAVKNPPTVHAVALHHDADSFIVLDGESPIAVRSIRPPRSATPSAKATWDLAHLIRRDGLTVSGSCELQCGDPSAEETLLLFGSPDLRLPKGEPTVKIEVDGVPAALAADPLRPLLVEPADVVQLDLGSARLDAAMLGRISSEVEPVLLTGTGWKLDRETGALRVSFEWPKNRAGQTWTLLMTLEDGAPLPGPQGSQQGSQQDSRRASRAAEGALVDVSLSSGIDAVHFEGDHEQLDIRPTMGPGAAWGDVDSDGWLDVVVLQGGGRSGVDPLPDRLFCGSANGTFVEATNTAGLASGDAGMGALFVDVNGDGHLDLYCANYGQDRLFLGRGDRTFTDATKLLPALDLWSASVSAADADGDGDLDLYITSYLDYDPAKMPPAEELGRYRREDPIEMLPFAFPGQRNVYLRSLLADSGALAFEDATEALGLEDIQGRGMQSVFWDFDQDGDDDLYVANDVSFNVLFRNEGDGTFKDVSFSTGLDDPRGGMGLAIGDVDRDGDEDVFLTNWQLEANALYLNSVVGKKGIKRRRASFHDSTVRSGLGPSGIGKTSWGAELMDLDLDGVLDLYVANGYTSPDYESTGLCVGQTDQLFMGLGKGRFREVVAGAASPKESIALPPAMSTITQASRGAIGADFDRDGDVDLLVTANNGRAVLLENRLPRTGHWVGVRLRQDGLNPYAIGASVTVSTDTGDTHRSTLRAGQGYLTGNAPELHFGVGAAKRVSGIEVTWPDGEVSRVDGKLDAWQTITRQD